MAAKENDAPKVAELIRAGADLDIKVTFLSYVDTASCSCPRFYNVTDGRYSMAPMALSFSERFVIKQIPCGAAGH